MRAWPSRYASPAPLQGLTTQVDRSYPLAPPFNATSPLSTEQVLMRLGIDDMLPGDFRTLTPEHFEAIRAINCTGAGFHSPGDILFETGAADCEGGRRAFEEAGVDLVQFAISYSECLFDSDETVRSAVLRKIERGIEVGGMLAAHCVLIRTGSLGPGGPYSPSSLNHSEDNHRRLVETLRQVADHAEAHDVTVVVETHVLTIMNSPETNMAVLSAVDSDRLGVVMDYVNHFQALHQVYDSCARIDHIFDTMGSRAPVGHCKDIAVREGFVVHLEEEVPGEGELDLNHALRRWDKLYPEGYMLLEHLPIEKYPLASENTRRIAVAAGVHIH